MKKIAFLISLLFLIQIKTSAQEETANWYFGYGAGMQFDLTSGTVNALNGGQLSTNEGCASMSDSNGNLLFYTDGTTVWNRNHLIMQNGTGLFGNSSSTQSAIIVPQPNNPNIYFVFTVDNNLDLVNNGLNYSIVDTTLDSGLGGVTNKNINLLPICSEKITAVLKDCITGSIWVVTFASQNGNTTTYNSFHAFEVTDTGVNPASVVSTFNLAITDARGYLKLSPDGTKLANANARNGLYLYDFDADTGIVSNQRQLTINTQSNRPYGLEFSPNNRFLYVHSSNDYFNQQNPDENDVLSNHNSTLTQFDVTVTNVQATEFTVDQRQLYRGGLQQGPDGKIYRALSSTYNTGLPFLGVINSPNFQGASCNYQHNGIDLSPNLSSQGLPPFIQSLFAQIDIIQNNISDTYLPLCLGNDYTLQYDFVVGATYTWTKNGNPLNLPSHQNFLDLIDVSQADSGIYQLIIDFNNGDCVSTGTATVMVNLPPEANDYPLTQCDVDPDNSTDGIATFNLNEAYDGITGSVDDLELLFFEDNTQLSNNTPITNTTAFRNAFLGQSIIVKVTNPSTTCFSFANLTLNVQPTLVSLPYTGPFFTCDDDVNDGILQGTFNIEEIKNDYFSAFDANFYASLDDAISEINPLPDMYPTENTTIYLRVENNNECQGIEEIDLIVDPKPVVTIDDFILCIDNPPLKISAEDGFNTYNWYQIQLGGTETLIGSSQTIDIFEIGEYRLELGIEYNSFGVNRTCENSTTFLVEPSQEAIFSDIIVTDASDNNTITVLVTGKGDYEYALDDINGPYYDNNTFENVSAGFHTVYVRDKKDCGIVDQLVSIIGFPKFFTPNNDGVNDTWQIKGVNDQFQPNTVIHIFNRHGKLLKQLSPTGPGWDGTYQGQPLKTDDYWFSITLQDGRTFNSHFTLKR